MARRYLGVYAHRIGVAEREEPLKNAI
jgi:hypothetical protein